MLQSTCRICQAPHLKEIFNLGSQVLGCRFPASNESDPIEAPLILVQCQGECGLLQLSHTVSATELYLNHYGYRSGLNQTMINHLTHLVEEIEDKIKINKEDVILDIGSNDCTTLKAYRHSCRLIGIDPTGKQFQQYYPDHVTLVPTFFDADTYCNHCTKKAKVVTTISMFYDLPDPVQFAQHIKNILASDGIWVSEQSYAVTMVEKNSFDTIVHEHLEFYTLKQFKYIADKTGLKIIDVTLNECNGGSFRVTLSHADSHYPVSTNVDNLLKQELLFNDQVLIDFVTRCQNNKIKVYNFLKEQKDQGKKIYLYGASTKGNTLLQYYHLDGTIITAAAERNPEKYGRRTPGTNIPIVSEAEMRESKPDFLLVLPWHFKEEFLKREEEYLKYGKIIFPLPEMTIY